MQYAQALNKLTTSKIADIHNQFAELSVNRFSDKDTAIQRTSKVLIDAGVSLKQIEELIASNGNAEDLKPDLDVEKEVKKPKASNGEKKKRNHFKDKMIYLKEAVESKFRKDSDRDVVFKKLVASSKSKFTFDEFCSFGGTSFLLKIFLMNGVVEVKSDC